MSPSLRASLRPNRAVYLSYATVLIACLMGRGIRGQDQIRLNRLIPSKPAIYVWTNDVPELLRRLEETQWRPLETLRHVWELDSSYIRDEHETAQMLLELQTLSELHDELEAGIFDGQAMIVRSIGRGGKSSDLIVVDSAADEERVAKFMRNVDRLLSPSSEPDKATRDEHAAQEGRSNGDSKAAVSQQKETDNGPFTLHRLKASQLYWAFVKGRLCISPEEQQVTPIATILLANDQPLESLATDRKYQTAMMVADIEARGQGAIEFYLSPEAVSRATSFNQNDYSMSLPWFAITNDERDLKRSQLSGLSGRLEFGQDSRLERVDTRLFGSAFLVITQPRHGLLKAVGRGEALDFAVPTPEGEITNVRLLNLNGTQVASESLESLAELPGGTPRHHSAYVVQVLASQGRHFFEGVIWDPALARHVQQLAVVGTVREENLNLPGGYFTDDRRIEYAVKFEAGRDVVDDVHRLLNVPDVNRQLFDLSSARPGLAMSRDDDQVTWSLTDETKESYLAASLVQRTHEYETRTKDDGDLTSRDLGRQLTKEEIDENERYARELYELRLWSDQQSSERKIVLGDDWFRAYGSQASDYHQSGRQGSRSRLHRLEEVVSEMSQGYHQDGTPCFVDANWLSLLKKRLGFVPRSYAEGNRGEYPTTFVDGDNEADGVGQERYQTRRIRFFDAMFDEVEMAVITATNHEMGFRFRFALTMPDD